MSHKIVSTDKAPAAIGPYSQATIYKNMVYCSGQIALDPGTNEIIEGGVKDQARQVMENLGKVLEEAGSGFDKVLRCTIFLDNMDDFPVVNEVYGSYFPGKPPARETVAVETLPKNVLVEVSCIAYI